MSTISRRAFLKTVGIGALSVAAMSVLAGCDTVAQPPVDNGQTVSNITADVQAEVLRQLDRTSLPSYITFASNAALNSDLEFTVGGAGVLDVLPNYMLGDALTSITATGAASDLYNTLAGEVDVTTLSATNFSIPLTLASIGTVLTLKDAEEYLAEDGASSIPVARAVGLWSISSEIAYANLVRQIAGAFINIVATSADDFANLLNAIPATPGNEGYNFRFNYAISVSTVTKQVNSSSVGVGGEDLDVLPDGVTSGSIGAADPSATFVAVQIVRTASAQ